MIWKREPQPHLYKDKEVEKPDTTLPKDKIGILSVTLGFTERIKVATVLGDLYIYIPKNGKRKIAFQGSKEIFVINRETFNE